MDKNLVIMDSITFKEWYHKMLLKNTNEEMVKCFEIMLNGLYSINQNNLSNKDTEKLINRINLCEKLKYKYFLYTLCP